MKKEEATKIVLKLTALFPNTEVKETTIAVWVEYLIPLDASVVKQAINEYALAPGKKFFPTPGEIIDIYDRIYQDVMTKKAQADREANNDATKLLFHEQPEKIKAKYSDIVALSCQLVRDVCDGKVKYQSPEWNKRQGEIERMV